MLTRRGFRFQRIGSWLVRRRAVAQRHCSRPSRRGLARCALATGCAALCFAAGPAVAQGPPQRGEIKAVDLEQGVVTVTAGGVDLELIASPWTRYMDPAGAPIANGLKHAGFKPGVPIYFVSLQVDGKSTLVGMRLVGARGAGPAPGSARPPGLARPPAPADMSAVKPLTEMTVEDRYRDVPGGLYPGAARERPPEHEAAGLALAKEIRPLDGEGRPSPSGKIVVLAIGMSNTRQAFDGFRRAFADDCDHNPRVALVNGAVGGMTAFRIQQVDDQPQPDGRPGYWRQVDQILTNSDATRAQVQAVWLKQADAGPQEGFPGYAKKLQSELANIVRILRERFPNLKLVYLSSRSYGGWAKTPLNPEPYAYESAFAVKWLIEDQLKHDPELNFDAATGPVKAPWLSWGPYLWANGSTPRADGFAYAPADFADDGTHESSSGQEKIGRLLLQFFKTDTTTRGWFCSK